MVRAINLEEDNSNWLEIAKNELISGHPIIIPTDTVYGIAALSDDKNSLEKIFSLKKRDANKPFAVFYETAERALPYIDESLHKFYKLIADAFLPGPITVIADSSFIGREMLGTATLGVRVPSHQGILKLLSVLPAPLAVTSVNISGAKEPLCIGDIDEEFSSKKILIIDGGRTKFEAPSTVILLKVGKVELIREGALPFQKIEQVLYNY